MDFFKGSGVFFFFLCSTLSFSTIDYLKHILGLVKSFMVFFSQWCIFFFLPFVLLFFMDLKISTRLFATVKTVLDFFPRLHLSLIDQKIVQLQTIPYYPRLAKAFLIFGGSALHC